MSVNTGISSSTSEILALSEGNMFTIGVLVALSKTEINNVDVVLVVFLATNEEVVWLNISMNNTFFMYFLNSLNL
jgi:hypothetical protein